MPVSISKRAFELARFVDRKARVGIALRHCFVPILTTPVQINQLRSFPSEISLSEAVEKIKNYPVSSCSKFSHYSASIILLELLLEVAPGFRRSFSGSETLSPYCPVRVRVSLTAVRVAAPEISPAPFSICSFRSKTPLHFFREATICFSHLFRDLGCYFNLRPTPMSGAFFHEATRQTETRATIVVACISRQCSIPVLRISL